MEVFFDFGLFELVAALGFAAIARSVYRHKVLGIIFLAVSLAAPAILTYLAHGATVRSVAVVSLATALVNGTVVMGGLRTGNAPALLLRRNTRNTGEHVP